MFFVLRKPIISDARYWYKWIYEKKLWHYKADKKEEFFGAQIALAT
jgi:hypothetical protein